MSAGGRPRAERSGIGLGFQGRLEHKKLEPTRIVVAPLAPLVVAVAAGVLADRWLDPCLTKTWVTVALVLGAIAMLAIRHTILFCCAMLPAFAALGGGWHHHCWSDLAADDLAWSVTETPRPAWVRGVVNEARGLRHRREGFGFGTSDSEQVTSRFVLQLTSISDGRNWHPASGRAIVVVMGDRSEIRAGQAVEAAGQIAKAAPTLNPGEFDYRAFLQAQGIRLRLERRQPRQLLA